MSEDVWALPTTERKARTLQNFGFECRCARCENNDPNEQLQSDQKEDAIWGNLSNHWRRNAHHAEPEQSAKTPPRSSQSAARRRGNRLLPVSRQSPTTHSKSTSTTVMSRAQKSLHLWPWMRNVCVWNGTDSCELPPKEELARRPESHRLAFQTKKWSSAGSSSSSSKIAASPYSDEWLWRRAD